MKKNLLPVNMPQPPSSWYLKGLSKRNQKIAMAQWEFDCSLANEQLKKNAKRSSFRIVFCKLFKTVENKSGHFSWCPKPLWDEYEKNLKISQKF